MIDDDRRRIRHLLGVARQRLAVFGDERGVMAEVWLAHVVGKPRTWVLAHDDEMLNLDAAKRFADGIDRMALGEPLAYLTGERAFFGRDFSVSRAVLIPRPETELLVEQALAWARTRAPTRIIDVGAGSGIIGVTLAAELPQTDVVLTDVSTTALAVARANAERHGVFGRVRLAEGDLFAEEDGPFDLICSNPPYIDSDELSQLAVSRYEPLLALDGGAGGLAVVARLLTAAATRLAPGGRLLVEIGAGQGPSVARLAAVAFPCATVELMTDLAGHDRLLVLDQTE